MPRELPRSRLAAAAHTRFATAKTSASALFKPGFASVRIGQYYHFEIRATSDSSEFQAESACLEAAMANDR
ncbi:hypothetical protein SBA5_980019 [Candidatus Sulfotelmatomonas gaucii]|uniref:Uncharacterized protein n=1 Tax=Candidatus Sulfuritelmatomonas gaucii TaxID=2043161 RepID=A0A2N9MAH1_9BACT|nr:hypothetical protein SBA5_980019 [Candidatus Sulfotelmatomonas gaucii]